MASDVDWSNQGLLALAFGRMLEQSGDGAGRATESPRESIAAIKSAIIHRRFVATSLWSVV
jgi:hypothetical protein